MRSVVLIDTKIDKNEALALLDDFGEFFEKHTGIECEWFVERRDFSQVPTVVDAGGDMKPSPAYRTSLNNDVHSRYGDYGTDNVVMWVHEDNFLYKGIWGQAWAYVYHKHSFILARWDKDNSINTLYTLIHEILHPFDKVILEEVGIDIHEVIKQYILQNGTKADIDYIAKNGYNYDRDYVHGNLPSAMYIGRRGYTLSDENMRVLKLIAPHLKDALTIRKSKHFAPVREAQWKLIDALTLWIKNFVSSKK